MHQPGSHCIRVVRFLELDQLPTFISTLGHISVQRAILRVREFRSKAKDSVEAFVEEAVVRRELADNFCFYNPDHYDSIKGTNAWAQKTLQDHAQDKREYLYTREQLENGDTHDDLWNSAQVRISYAE